MSLKSLSRVTGSHVSKGANRPMPVSRPGTEWHFEFRADGRPTGSVDQPEVDQPEVDQPEVTGWAIVAQHYSQTGDDQNRSNPTVPAWVSR
jgi:hypothetical protein